MLRFFRISRFESRNKDSVSFLQKQESGFQLSHLRGIQRSKSRGNLVEIASSLDKSGSSQSPYNKEKV